MINIAFYNQRGGSGKSTGTYQVAGFLAAAGKRVLVVDIDPQSNTTSVLLAETLAEASEHEKRNLPCFLDVLAGKIDIKECIKPALICTRSGRAPRPVGIDVLPSNPDKDVKTLKVLPNLVTEILKPIQNDYDYAIFDFPPERPYATRKDYNLVFLTLCAMDKVVIPCGPDEDSFAGLSKLTEHVMQIKQYIRPQLNIVGCYLNGLGEFGNDRAILQVCESLDIYMGVAIRTSGHVRSSRSTYRPLAWYQSNSEAAKSYKLLAEKIVGYKL